MWILRPANRVFAFRFSPFRMETSEWAKIFLDFSLFSFFIPSYYSMPASIEKNDWTCGKEDLFEISVHRFETETTSKGCRICWVKGCRVESNFLFDRHRFKFSYSRASNYIRSCPDQVEISDARGWNVAGKKVWLDSVSVHACNSIK